MNLSEGQIKLLEESLELIKGKRPQFADSFYEVLFKRYPEVKPFFEKVNMMALRDKLIASLALVVGNLRTPEVMEADLQKLGKRHAMLRIKAEHYPLVESAMCETFSVYLDKRWTSAHHAAWKAALSEISKVMLSGYSS